MRFGKIWFKNKSGRRKIIPNCFRCGHEMGVCTLQGCKHWEVKKGRRCACGGFMKKKFKYDLPRKLVCPMNIHPTRLLVKLFDNLYQCPKCKEVFPRDEIGMMIHGARMERKNGV